MRIYPDEVMVTRGNLTTPCNLEVVWSAHEESETTSLFKQLASLLAIPECILRHMVNTKQLELFRRQGQLHFRCDNLEGIVPESSRTAGG
jgi:hypothetical protein